MLWRFRSETARGETSTNAGPSPASYLQLATCPNHHIITAKFTSPYAASYRAHEKIPIFFPLIGMDIFGVLVLWVHHSSLWDEKVFQNLVCVLWSASMYQMYVSDLQRGGDLSKLGQFVDIDREKYQKLTVPFLRKCQILKQLMFPEHRSNDGIVELPSPYNVVDGIILSLGISDMSHDLPMSVYKSWSIDSTLSYCLPPPNPPTVPSFIRLPPSFQQLIHHFISMSCHKCGTLPKMGGICLVCGRICCIAHRCCYVNELGECYQHSLECGGVFLMPKTSFTLVLRQDRRSLWNSIYVDERGEDDPNLRRGKPLFLDQERLSMLENMWIKQSYDEDPKITGATVLDAILM